MIEEDRDERRPARLAKTLLERETMDGDELHKLLSGEVLPPVDDKNNNGGKPGGQDTGKSESGIPIKTV